MRSQAVLLLVSTGARRYETPAAPLIVIEEEYRSRLQAQCPTERRTQSCVQQIIDSMPLKIGPVQWYIIGSLACYGMPMGLKIATIGRLACYGMPMGLFMS
jgi:hypothetical protein